MGLETQTLKEGIAMPALSAGLIPASVNGETNSGTIDMKLNYRAMFAVQIGAGTANAVIQQTNNSNGATATNVAGTALVLTANTAGTAEVRADQITARYIKLNITTDAAAIVGIMGFATPNRFNAQGQDNASSNNRVVANV